MKRPISTNKFNELTSKYHQENFHHQGCRFGIEFLLHQIAQYCPFHSIPLNLVPQCTVPIGGGHNYGFLQIFGSVHWFPTQRPGLSGRGRRNLRQLRSERGWLP